MCDHFTSKKYIFNAKKMSREIYNGMYLLRVLLCILQSLQVRTEEEMIQVNRIT